MSGKHINFRIALFIGLECYAFCFSLFKFVQYEHSMHTGLKMFVHKKLYN